MIASCYDWRTLPSGPRLAVATLPASECAALSIHIPAGSRDEQGFPAGLAHFVEHMVFKGTATRSARELSLAIESTGGQVNACTSEDQTVYDARGDAGSLDQLVDVLCDMLWRSAFPKSEVSLEREVIAEEITMYLENPGDRIGDLLSESLWAPHPLGHPISGTIDTIHTIHRNTLLEFHRRHYFRNDLVIALAGPFSLDDLENAISARLPSAFTEPLPHLPFDVGLSAPRDLREAIDTDQLQLALAWHTPGRHSASRHALRLLSTMLGESSSSRLFLELREERGLCYQVSSDVTLFDETGAFEIHAALNPSGRDEALACIHRELHDLASHGPRPGELERAKRLAITQGKFAFESSISHATWAGECLLDFGRIPAPTEWREQLQRVSDADIRDIAATIFDTRPSTAEILPQ